MKLHRIARLESLIQKSIQRIKSSFKITKYKTTNIIMLHNGRCGSTVVGHLLAQNPNIHWASELYTPLFKKWKKEHPNRFPLSEQKTIVEKPIEFLKNSMNETTKPYYGFEIKPIQLAPIGFLTANFLSQSFLLNFTYFILIRRKNWLRSIVSEKISVKTDVWHIKKNNFNKTIKKLEKIHLPVNQPKPLVEKIRGIERRMQEVETLLAGKNVLNLTYEDDIEQDPQSAYRSICKFVNMEETKASVTLSKTNPFPLKDMIENFAEVKAALHNTPYEWMPNS